MKGKVMQQKVIVILKKIKWYWWVAVIVFIVVFCVTLFLITNGKNNSQNIQNLNLSFKELGEIFKDREQMTDLQRQELWKKYQGQKVFWACDVVSIKETLGGYEADLRCDPDTLFGSADTMVEFDQSWKNKLLAYKENYSISISGILDSYKSDYSLFVCKLKNGEIK